MSKKTLPSLSEILSGIKDAAMAAAPGLANVGADLKAELGRLGTQGAAEIASALFGGSAFVQYGAGQRPAEASPDRSQQPAQEHDGMER